MNSLNFLMFWIFEGVADFFCVFIDFPKEILGFWLKILKIELFPKENKERNLRKSQQKTTKSKEFLRKSKKPNICRGFPS